MDKQISINKFIDQLPSRHKPVKNPKEYVIGGLVLEFDIIKQSILNFDRIHNIYND